MEQVIWFPKGGEKFRWSRVKGCYHFSRGLGSTIVLLNRSQCYEMKCITRVSFKFILQIIVGKYGTSSICSARTIREILTRF